MAEVDVNFMEEIRSFPVIWDRYATDFKNKHKKVNAFQSVGEKFGMSAEEAEKKYNSIRTMFSRHIKKQPSGSGRQSTNPMFEGMSWMKPFIKCRKTSSNIGMEESFGETSRIIAAAGSEEDEDMNSRRKYPEFDDINLHDIANSPSPPPPPSEQIETTAAPPKTKAPLGKRRRTALSEGENEFLKACKAVKETNMLMQARSQTEDDDELKLYFLSVAKRLKKMPPHYQRQIRFNLENQLFEAENVIQQEQLQSN